MNTLVRLVTETIEQLEAQNQPQPVQMEIVDDANDTPPWQSDAEREGLPTVNRTTGSGAPLLRTDDVLKWEPGHLGRKV